jgi:voltage-gated potassium channel
MTLRKTIYQLLEQNYRFGQQKSRFSFVINGFILLLIIGNVVAIVLESVKPIAQAYQAFFLYFEWFSIAIFTLEYCLRLWCCVERFEPVSPARAWKIRWNYMTSPMAIIDLLAIIPFYLSFFITIDLRLLRVIRLLRIFKLGRYSVAIKTLIDVFREEMPALIAANVIMFILIILVSSGIYLLEHQVQPEHFGNIPSAMWWAIITLTTVGYGDVTPVTVGGKVFGGIISLIGVAMVAIPTGIIASGFANVFRRRRERYELKIASALADGKLSDDDMKELKQSQESLGLSDADAHQILREMLKAHKLNGGLCPHCHQPLISPKIK